MAPVPEVDAGIAPVSEGIMIPATFHPHEFPSNSLGPLLATSLGKRGDYGKDFDSNKNSFGS
jgi:hypothetical protein